MCIHVQSITYMHPDKDVLFSNVSFTISKGQKVALIGNNGSGKSTLMRLITKELLPSEGQIICPEDAYKRQSHVFMATMVTKALITASQTSTCPMLLICVSRMLLCHIHSPKHGLPKYLCRSYVLLSV